MNYNNGEIDDTVKLYFKDLKENKPLTKKEEHELLWKYKYNHDISARNKLINANLKYACQLASSYRNRGVCYSDLISEANDGLIEAIDKFDLKHDVKFFSYSKWWMMQKMQSAIDKKNRMPESEIPEEKDTPIMDDEDITAKGKPQYTYEDAFTTEEEMNEDENDRNRFLNELLSVLNEREYDMVNMYFGRNGYRQNTLEDIGKKYKLTKERVRQIIEGAFTKLRAKSMIIDNMYLSR